MRIENKNGSILNKTKNIGIIYLSLIVLFITTMVISYAIPNKRINWHVSESVEQLKIEGLYPRPFLNTPAIQLDNFTDAWMLNLAISADNKHPLKSSQQSPHKVVKEYHTGQVDKIGNLDKSINSKDYETKSYTRYWHGYLTVLRPLLVFLSYTEIRFINMCGLMLLFIVANSLLKKKLGTKIMISFFLSMMMIMFIIVPMSLQFSSIFYITFISMIIMLMYDKKIEENNLAIYMFFIIGSITSFLDLLTAPVITLGIPLITYILLINKTTTKQAIKIGEINVEKEYSISNNTIEVIKNSILWGLGYGLTWASKWVISSIILKENIVKDALNQILSRTSDTSGETIISANQVITNNTDLIYTDFILKLFVIIAIIWIIGMVLYRKPTKKIINILPILLIAVIPYVWYVILKNHSYMHFWFTYRSLSITTFAILAFMSYSIDNNKK